MSVCAGGVSQCSSLGEGKGKRRQKGKSGIVSSGNAGLEQWLEQLHLRCLGTIRLQPHEMLFRSVAPVGPPTLVARVFECGYLGWACGKQLLYANLYLQALPDCRRKMV